MAAIDINTGNIVALSRKLERLNRSALPVAVRQTLDNAAFDVKKKTMPAEADRAFIKRKPSFFRAKSRTFKATGFNINAMKAITGFVGNDQAIQDLYQQQYGGKIKGRAFIPMSQSRTGNNPNRNVRVKNRITNIKKVIDASVGKRSKKQNFIRAAIMAKKLYGNDAYVLAQTGSGKTLFRIDDIYQSLKSRKFVMKSTPLYDYEKNRSVRVKGTGFMSMAANKSAAKMPDYFRKNAERRFERALR